MAQSINLPAHTLTNPLETQDEHILRQVVSNSKRLHEVIQQAKEAGLEVAHHEERVNMHHGIASKLLDSFFPAQLSQPPESDPSEL